MQLFLMKKKLLMLLYTTMEIELWSPFNNVSCFSSIYNNPWLFLSNISDYIFNLHIIKLIVNITDRQDSIITQRNIYS